LPVGGNETRRFVRPGGFQSMARIDIRSYYTFLNNIFSWL